MFRDYALHPPGIHELRSAVKTDPGGSTYDYIRNRVNAVTPVQSGLIYFPELIKPRSGRSLWKYIVANLCVRKLEVGIQ